jgi:phosphoribosylglycinamide formyltransferase 1
VNKGLPTAFLASGAGSNVRRLLELYRTQEERRVPGDPELAWRPALLLSDRAEAPALELAHAAGIPTQLLPADPEASEAVLLSALESHGIRLVILAGYLRLVPPSVVQRFRGALVNLHPSLLPAFGGKGMYGRRVHEAVLASGTQVTGVTVHRVDERFDEGPILAQWPVPVLPGDTVASLAERIQGVEHRLLPAAVNHLALALQVGQEPEPLSPLDLAAIGLEYP